MKKLIEENDLYTIAEQIKSNVDILDLLDDNEGDEIGYYTPQIRQAAEDLAAIAAGSEPATNKQDVISE